MLCRLLTVICATSMNRGERSAQQRHDKSDLPLISCSEADFPEFVKALVYMYGRNELRLPNFTDTIIKPLSDYFSPALPTI